MRPTRADADEAGGLRPDLAERQRGAPARILLVDDDSETREVLRDYLLDSGYEVQVAADGNQACATLVRFIADLVITDLEMPGMDGLQLIRWLRTARASCSILLVTGRTDQELQLCRFGKLAGFECMHKPIDVDELGHTVERLTSSGYGAAESSVGR
jgi:DNA-binding response OmpR family regulator